MHDFTGESEQIIRFSCARLLRLFVPLAILMCVSVVINPEAWRRAPTWTYCVFGGLALFILVGCLVLPRRYFLHLTPEGLSIQYLTSRRHYSWNEVRGFRVKEGPNVGHLPGGRMIVFDLATDSPHRTALVEAAAAINKYDVSFLATFGIAAEELVDVLTSWQQRYGNTASMGE